MQVNAVAQRARVVWRDSKVSLPQLLQALARIGYRALPLDARGLDDLRRRESRDALKRLLVAGFGAMQAMMYATALYLGAADTLDASTRDLLRWLGLLVATPVVFYSARPFFAGALRSLQARRVGMDVPVALAISAVYAASLIEAVRGSWRGVLRFDIDVRVLPARRPLPRNACATSRARPHRCAGPADSALRRSAVRRRNLAARRYPRAAGRRLRARGRRRHRARRRSVAERALPRRRSACSAANPRQ